MSGDETHDWFTPRTAKWEACRRCGIVRRADRQNKPCKGNVFVTLREKGAVVPGDQTSAPETPKAADGGEYAVRVSAAVQAMYNAHRALMDLGWREAIYCPKDGTEFLAIEPGSTGIHDCFYMGEWPDGGWWGPCAGDLYPMRPVLFKLKS